MVAYFLLVILKCLLSDAINIPTFSTETNWESSETYNKLSIAIEETGFAYFQMTETDQKLYELITPTIFSFFHETAKWDADYLPNQDLNFSIWRKNDIFYGYVNYQRIKPYQQCRCFMMPIQSTSIDILNHPSNPFKNDPNVLKFAESISNHALLLLYHSIRYVFKKHSKNGLNDEVCNNDFGLLIGNNPAKHFGINYFNSNELNANIKYGIIEHTDSDFISILASTSNGLQIKYNNEWIDINYNQNKMIVNFGTMMDILTNHANAVRHRVKIVNKGERLSFGIFLNADISGYIYKYQNDTLIPIKTVLQHFQDSFDEYLNDQSY